MLLHYIKRDRFVFIFFTTLILISTLFATNIKAHSPSSMNISYDLEAKTIDAVITHTVSNPGSHYVNKLEIKINDELYETFEYTSQPGSSFTYSLDSINASTGDIIEVKALCNQGGQITKQLTVGEENGESTDEESTPGFEIMLFIISLGMVIFLIKYKSKQKGK
jgi:hypothetical protein